MNLNKLLPKYYGKRCFILGNGPSLGDIDISLLQNEITIGVNNIMKSGFVPNFLVISDTNTLEKYSEDILNNKMKNGYYILGNNPEFTENLIEKMKYFNNIKFVKHKEKTGVQYGQDKTKSIEFVRENFYIDDKLENYSCYGGSVVHDLAIPTALHLGFKNIYLLGCDGGFRHFFAKDGEDDRVPNLVRKYGETRPYQYYEVIREILEKRDVNIYNSSPTNNFNELEYRDFIKVIRGEYYE